MGSLGKWLQLSNGDRSLLLRTLLLLSSIRLGLWLLPFKTLQLWLQRLHAPQVSPSSWAESIRRVVWAVETVSGRMPGGVQCLARALTTHTLLRQRGCACELRIGVAKADPGTLEAHAWVEHEGTVIMGKIRGLSRFTPLPTLEGKLQETRI